MTNRIAFNVLGIVLLAAAVCAIYSRALTSPFIFDDPAGIAENPSILQVWPLWGDSEHPGPLNPPKDNTTSGRPLVNLSLAINYHFGKLDPFGYHVFNLIVHLLSAILLMAIVQRTLCLDYFAGRFQRASGPLAFAVALLWALHPLQTETVVYVTQRTELMVGFFYLATLYASLRYWAAPSPAIRAIWLALSILSCFAGMACKEVMVTAPAIVLLFQRTLITGSFRRSWQKSWPLYVGLTSSWALLFWLNHHGPRSLTAGFNVGLAAQTWWLTQTKVLLTYLKLTIWPWPLSIHYETPYLTTLSAAWPWLASAILLAVGTFWLLWRRSAIGFVGAWVLLILSPTLLVPIITEVAAERRMYLPLAALLTLLVVGAYSLAQKAAPHSAAVADQRTSVVRWPAALAAALVLTLALILSVASANRLADYRDPITLWQNALATETDNCVAHNNLGSALALAGRTQEAIEHFLAALRLKPDFADAHYNFGLAMADSGQLQKAIDHYQQAILIRPSYAEARANLAIALALAGRSQEAIQQFNLVLQLKPNQAKAHYNLAVALAREGRHPEAIQQYEQALRLQPDYAQAYANLAQSLADTARHDEARSMVQKALELARAQGQSDLAQRLEAWLATDHAPSSQNDSSSNRTGRPSQ